MALSTLTAMHGNASAKLRTDGILQAKQNSSLPVRSPSVKATLSTSANSSVASSPALGPLLEITPLPSPILSGGSPGPWKLMASQPYSENLLPYTPQESVLITANGESISSALAHQQKRNTYRGIGHTHTKSLNSPVPTRQENVAGHVKNRDVSEYVPETVHGRRPRHVTVSDSAGPRLFGPAVDGDCHLRREPCVAAQRGLIGPDGQPPTPPPSSGPESDRGSLGAAGSGGPATATIARARHEVFEATGVRDHLRRRWTEVRDLGMGSFSRVVLATSQEGVRFSDENVSKAGQASVDEVEPDPKQLVAVKIVEHGPAGGESEERLDISLKRELDILTAIRHPSLVLLKAFSIEPTRALLVLSYCTGGDMYDFASQHSDLLVPALIQRIFAELVGATAYLHGQLIVHRDVKLENVLLNLRPEEVARIEDWHSYPFSVVTLTDMGLSRRIDPADPKLHTRCGSEDYAAPELLMGQPYDGRQTDAWALGVLLYALMEGRLPFDPLPGASEQQRVRSRTVHRIARCDWAWYKFTDADGEPGNFGELEGARPVVEVLLKRASGRATLEKVASTEWVKSAIQVEGGIKYKEEVDGIRRLLSSTGRTRAPAAENLNKTSRHVTQPKSQGASQAMLYATGLEPSDMDKAQVGISSVWYSGNPCNMHLLELNHRVKEGVERAGLIGYQFNTVGVSDAISMGTKGMRYSLQSRDLIADSIETVMGGQWYDANISIPGCDKNMPGVVMAMGRVNRPSLMVYGGTIQPGCAATQGNADIDVVSAFQAYGQFITGEIDEDTRFDIIRNACPGGGACGGMYTANTMATAIEVMGLTLPGSSSNPAESRAKQLECLAAGGAIKELLAQDIRPRDILTRQAFENAMVLVNITGGSTNAVLHLIAIAHSVGVKLTIDDFQSVSDRTPFLANLKPSGKYVMTDLHKIGGTPALLRYLLKEGLIHGGGMTVTGKTLKENVEHAPDFPSDQTVIRPLSDPIKQTGHIQILRGSLAPGGSVGKITGKEGTRFEGKARVYDGEEAFIAALERGEIKKGEKTVVVIRYEGPKGGPGMPEMLKPSSAIMGAGLGQDVALITDGRFSGGSHGFLIGHIVPEAQEGGPIALVKDGDTIAIDADTRRLDLVSADDAELQRRRAAWTQPAMKYEKGVLAKYARYGPHPTFTGV
ncbi:MAG: dihydroxy-acid dehydratase ilv3 [Thelocarpon impressellum]|nr:MAG: dihydroxy-acid dehydratase ilv3 [Thelocarpon impressellum]